MGGPIRRQASFVLRFVLELCALAALFCWGLWASDGRTSGFALGAGASLLAMVLWGLFAAPACPCRRPEGSRSSQRSIGSASAGFWATGQFVPSLVLLGLAIFDRAPIQA